MWFYVEYETSRELVDAVIQGAVDGIAIDHYTFHDLQHNPDYLKELDHEVIASPGYTVGYMLYDHEQSEMLSCLRLQAFINELNVDSTIMRSLSHTSSSRDINDEVALAMETAALNIMTKNMRVQLYILCGAFAILLLAIGIADVCVRLRRKKREQDAQMTSDNNKYCHDTNVNEASRKSGTNEEEQTLTVFKNTAALYPDPEAVDNMEHYVLCDRCRAIVS
jgi:hypothetical protein